MTSLQRVLSAGFAGWFCLYAFVFIPLYNVFLDAFVTLTGVRKIPVAASLVKDIAWLAVLASFVVWLLLRHRHPQLPRGVWIPLLLFVAYFVGQAARGISLLGVYDVALAVRNSLGYVPAILIPLAIVGSRRDLVRLVTYFAYMAWGAAVYALVEVVGLFHGRYYEMARRPELLQSVPSFFSDYNIFAYFACMTFALTLAGHQGKLSRTSLMFSAMLVSAGGAIASQSRGGLAALFMAAFLFLLLRMLDLSTVVGILGVVMLIVIVAPQLVMHHRVLNSVSSVSSYGAEAFMPSGSGRVPGNGGSGRVPANDGAAPSSVDVRFSGGWPMLFRRFKERALLGYGLGTYGFARLRVESETGVIDKFVGVDNFYLTLALNTGIVGLGLFAWLLVAVFWFFCDLIRECARDRGMHALVAGIGVALVAFLISGLFTNLLESFPISFYFWLLIGLIFSIRILLRDGSRANNVMVAGLTTAFHLKMGRRCIGH